MKELVLFYVVMKVKLVKMILHQELVQECQLLLEKNY